MIGLDVCFSYWSRAFYNALQEYQAKLVFSYLGLFCVLAGVYVLVAGFTSYFQRFLEFGVRENLFDRYSTTWTKTKVTNPEQRLSEDTINFGKLALELLQALIVAGIKLPVFLFILWSVGNWWISADLFTYAILGTVGSKLVSRKLINLEFVQQTREAKFRKAITYAVDSGNRFPTLDEIKENWVELARQNKLLSFFVSGFNQTGVVLPYVMLLPLYLTRKVALGSFFQVASAAGTVLDSLSVLVNSRRIIVELSATTLRLKEME
jgi:putative ATP-binding cassette transporter